MISELTRYLNKIHWLPSTTRIPSWQERGIPHGFEGRGFELGAQGHSLRQIHSAKIVESGPKPEEEEGDALLTSLQGRVIAVKTADCVPLLILHPRAVLAIHAGWRGMSQDIIGESLRAMRARSWEIEASEVAIGPCLSLAGFEVGPEVIEAFRQGAFRMQDAEFAFASSKGQRDRWQLDLAMLAALQLARYGFRPEQLHIIRTCTKIESDRWYSYRREGQGVGRNWSWIQKP